MLDVHEHGVDPLNYRQRLGLVAGNQRAHGEQRTPDAPGDRRGNAGELQVDVGGLQLRAALLDRCGSLTRGGGGIDIILQRHRLRLGQRLQPLGPDAGCLGIGHGTVEVGVRLCGRRPIQPWIDFVERLPCPHHRAFGEEPAADDAGDLRANLGHLEGSDPPG